MAKIRILPASDPPRNTRGGRWNEVVLRMKNKQSVIVDNELDSKAFRNAALYLGKFTTRRKVSGKGWRCWILDKPFSVKER
jgi:hypothetical protein